MIAFYEVATAHTHSALTAHEQYNHLTNIMMTAHGQCTELTDDKRAICAVCLSLKMVGVA